MHSLGEVMDRINQIAEVCCRILMIIAGVAMVAMMIHICADVFWKYAFNRPIIGTLEIVANYYMVLCVFLPIAYAQLRRQNLMVELFTLNVPTRYVAILDGIVALLSVCFVGLLAWLVFGEAVNATRNGEIRDITYFDMPIWPVRWALPLSFGLMTFVMVVQAINDLRFGFTGRGQPTLEIMKSQSLQVE